MQIDRPIPTNIITGFLGSGKTTLIQHLLKAKPENERWAILVNEFGEVGIDGAMFEGQAHDGQVFIREVPGGCMCCTSGLPMQIALNQLIARAKPDRLVIEPTGLGHPKEVIDTFAQPHYQKVIDLKATFTLVDARRIAEARVREHQGFQDQIKVADRVLASKSDLYPDGVFNELVSYLADLDCSHKPLQEITHGQLDSSLLDTPSAASLKNEGHDHSHHHHDSGSIHDLEQQVAVNGFASVENQGEGYFSKGWIFTADKVFDHDKLFHLLYETEVERLKGVVITNKGIFSFNKSEDVVSSQELDESYDSRIEVIDSAKPDWGKLDLNIKACLTEN